VLAWPAEWQTASQQIYHAAPAVLAGRVIRPKPAPAQSCPVAPLYDLADMSPLIYKVLSDTEWHAATLCGEFTGSVVDKRDGYLHFSTEPQLFETVRKHFAGQTNLVLLSVRAEDLGAAVKWEPSRGGDLFPHLYGPLPVSAVISVSLLPLGPDGVHQFPNQLAGRE